MYENVFKGKHKNGQTSQKKLMKIPKNEAVTELNQKLLDSENLIDHHLERKRRSSV